MRTIKVTGKGNLKVRPDLTRISITLSNKFKEYAEAMEHSSEDTEKLKKLLTGFGFESSDVKTLDFSVDAEYEGYREGDEYRQRLAGYRYRHVLFAEFGMDNDRLGHILYALAYSDLNPEFSVSYTVRDPEAVRNVLLGKAVSDAAEKASVLADSAGVVLKGIQNIDYSWGDAGMEVRPMGRMMACGQNAAGAAKSFSMDIEPDDISLSDAVTVIWEIE